MVFTFRTGSALLLPAALALALASAACRQERQEQREDVASQEAASGVEAVFRFGPLELGSTRAELEERLGAPDSIRHHTLTNPHDPAVTDTVFTVYHPGLVTGIYRASYDGRELLSTRTITDNRHLQAESPLRLGMGREEVRLALGEPDRSEYSDLFYACLTCSVGGQHELELRFDGGRLRAIILHYWID